MDDNRSLLCFILGFVLLTLMASSGRAASARHLSHGGTILLLGDSIFDLHTGDKRVEAIMKRMLEQRVPGARWTIYNEAHGGEYIGPKEGTPEGVSEPLFTSKDSGRYFEIVRRHPKADAVIVNYGANDSKVYPPTAFRKRLEALGNQIEKDYPGAILIFCTTMYVDLKHSAPYRRDNPMVPGFKNGESRDKYLEPYNREIREFAAEHGYGLADTFRHIKAETQKGNWDLRLRADDGNPKDDLKHSGDMKWFDNIHPNDKGTEVIARGLVDALIGPTNSANENSQQSYELPRPCHAESQRLCRRPHSLLNDIIPLTQSVQPLIGSAAPSVILKHGKPKPPIRIGRLSVNQPLGVSLGPENVAPASIVLIGGTYYPHKAVTKIRDAHGYWA